MSPHRTASIARLEGTDRLFRDAHNFVVELATTTGLLGLASFLGWLVLASRRARGSWPWCAAILGLGQLVEPMSVVVTPLGLLALGAACPRPLAQSPPGTVVTTAALAAVGLITASMLLVGEFQLQRGSLDFSLPALERAERLLPRAWPTVPLVATRVHGFYGASDPASRAAAVNEAREATRRAPYDPTTWLRRANLEAVWGSKQQAAVAFERALRLDPWSGHALAGRALLAAEMGDAEQAAALCRRAKQVLTTGNCGGRPIAAW